MGDLGWQDSRGRIWFCGRKSHRVITREQVLFTIPVEAIFNNHTEVFRSALAGVGHKNAQTPVIFIEPKAKIKDTKTFIRELKALGSSNQLTAGIEHFFIEKSFPVDIRHNSKIFREKLAEKAKKENVDLVVLTGDITGLVETDNIIKPFIDNGKLSSHGSTCIHITGIWFNTFIVS